MYGKQSLDSMTERLDLVSFGAPIYILLFVYWKNTVKTSIEYMYSQVLLSTSNFTHKNVGFFVIKIQNVSFYQNNYLLSK